MAADLSAYCIDLARRSRDASRILATIPGSAKDRWLRRAADALSEHFSDIHAANELDLAAAPGFGLRVAEIDRLRLTAARLKAAADGLREVAALPDPVGQIRESR